MKITVNLTPEEHKKVEIVKARHSLPSAETAIRKMLELHQISPGTR